MLQIGDKAPDFTLPSADGEVGLTDYDGHNVVLYFYPRDDTPGCTSEAQDFTRLKPDFDALDATVLGVSRDTVARHEKFAGKYDLDVTLLSDASGTVCEDYGVWVEKSMYGRTSFGIERSTFLIDAQGTIRRAWRRVKVAGHAEQVLEAVRALPR